MIEKTPEEDNFELKKVLCWPSPGCTGLCGLQVEVNKGKITKIKGNPDHPVSRGQICSKRAPNIRKWLYHPDQLMHPLKRVGERGEDTWQRISWDQAMDEIADKLQQLSTESGPETLAFIEGTLRSDLYGIRARFQNLFGNPGNIGNPGNVCACDVRSFLLAVSGSQCSTANTDISKCIVLTGKHLSESAPIQWRQIKRQLKENPEKKLIVVDPRNTEEAQLADIWLQIRPGTDTALYMAWLNIIIEEHLYDEAFVNEWTFGFNQLSQRAKEYPTEKVAEITWIPAERIREAARMYAGNGPACFIRGVATGQIGLNSIRAEQARFCLRAITGNMSVNGPETMLGPGPLIDGKMGIRDSMLQMEEMCPQEQRKKQLGSDTYKLMTWPAWELINKIYKETYNIPLSMADRNISAPQHLVWRAILSGKPYPIRALITWTSNPMVQAANTKIVYKALKSSNLDLHVVLEHFMTPTAMLADYVLPSASKLEKPVVTTMEDFLPTFFCGEAAVDPLGERRSDYYFFRDLAERLGYGEYFPWETEENFNDYRLAPLGLTFKEAAREKFLVKSSMPWTYETVNPKTGKSTGFATPSGKLELYSNILEKLGYDPLPFYEEPPESPVRTPDIFKEYPLILNTGGRFLPQFHSDHRQLGMGMREQHPDPLMDINPDTAAGLGISDGDWACVETRRGVIKMKSRYNNGITPGVVNIEASWWFPEQPGKEPCLHGVWQSNGNILTIDDPEACDPLTGGWAMRALLCRVYKADIPDNSN